MTNAQRQAAEMTLLHPDWTDAKIAQELGKSAVWLCKLKKKQEYQQYLKERMNEVWNDAGKQARKRMIELLNGRDDVAYKAAQFILQTTGLNPTTKIEADVNGAIELVIDGFDEDEIKVTEDSILT